MSMMGTDYSAWAADKPAPVTYGQADDFLYDPTLISTDGELVAAAVAWTLPLVALAHPRTRGAGTLALAVLLSRAHSHARRNLEAVVCGLYPARQSVAERVRKLERRVDQQRAIIMRQQKRLGTLEGITDALAAGKEPYATFTAWPDPDNDSGASG